MKIRALREAVKKAVKDQFKVLKQVETHPGKMNLEELKRVGSNTPSVHIAVLGLGKPEPVGDGLVDRDVKFVAFIITGNRRKESHDESVLDIVEDLVLWLPGKSFDKPAAEEGHIGGLHVIQPEQVGEATNLFSSKLGNNAASIWGLSWHQTVRFGESEFVTYEAELQVFASRAPKIGTAHKDDYVRVGDHGS